MKQKFTKNQLKALIVELSIDHHRACLAVTRRRDDLNDEYARYFRVHGQPEPNYRGIRLGDLRYAGVIEHTNEACAALIKAKQQRYSAKRRWDLAVRRLMLLTGASFALPNEKPTAKRPALSVVKRFNASGESLQ